MTIGESMDRMLMMIRKAAVERKQAGLSVESIACTGRTSCTTVRRIEVGGITTVDTFIRYLDACGFELVMRRKVEE